MPSIYDLKPAFQNLLRPVCTRLAARGVTANHVTGAALFMSLAHGAWIALSAGSTASLILLPVTLFARMALNAVDGMLAREHDMKSRKGALFNELADLASDAALYLPFALVAGVTPALAMLVTVLVVVAMIAEAAGMLGPLIGGSRRYEGPFGKSDRAFAFGVLALLLAYGFAPGGWMGAILMVWIFLSIWTMVNRCRAALEETE